MTVTANNLNDLSTPAASSSMTPTVAMMPAEHDIEEWVEHRRSKRDMLACSVKVSVAHQDQETSHPGKIRNVAAHGLFIETADPPESGTYVQVLFYLPGQDMTYQLWGRVAHTADDGLGLAVDILESGSYAALSAISNLLQG